MSFRFADKTRNEWANRKAFIKVPGKYDLLEMDYSAKVSFIPTVNLRNIKFFVF